MAPHTFGIFLNSLLIIQVSAHGDILHMGSVAVGPEHKDRYLVLFHDVLLILSVSSRMSAFIYEGKLPLSGIAVNRLEDTDNVKNSFEITGKHNKIPWSKR